MGANLAESTHQREEASFLTMIYFIKKKVLRFLFERILRRSPSDMPIVRYWKTGESVAAKITTDENGAIIMKMQGEDYPLYSYPRGFLLYGSLSKLKHEVKDQIFNDSWKMLESGKSEQEVVQRIKFILADGIKVRDTSTIGGRAYAKGEDLGDIIRYDMIPPERMCSAVREIWRGFTALERRHPAIKFLKEYFTFLLVEDDSYRYRVQWLVNIFNPSSLLFKLFGDPIRDFELALTELEHAEVIGDMKERIRLLRRVLLVLLKDETVKGLFLQLCKEIDWNKLKLTEADKYSFRAKYFKVDFMQFSY